MVIIKLTIEEYGLISKVCPSEINQMSIRIDNDKYVTLNIEDDDLFYVTLDKIQDAFSSEIPLYGDWFSYRARILDNVLAKFYGAK